MINKRGEYLIIDCWFRFLWLCKAVFLLLSEIGDDKIEKKTRRIAWLHIEWRQILALLIFSVILQKNPFCVINYLVNRWILGRLISCRWTRSRLYYLHGTIIRYIRRHHKIVIKYDVSEYKITMDMTSHCSIHYLCWLHMCWMNLAKQKVLIYQDHPTSFRWWKPYLSVFIMLWDYDLDFGKYFLCFWCIVKQVKNKTNLLIEFVKHTDSSIHDVSSWYMIVHRRVILVYIVRVVTIL